MDDPTQMCATGSCAAKNLTATTTHSDHDLEWEIIENNCNVKFDPAPGTGTTATLVAQDEGGTCIVLAKDPELGCGDTMEVTVVKLAFPDTKPVLLEAATDAEWASKEFGVTEDIPINVTPDGRTLEWELSTTAELVKEVGPPGETYEFQVTTDTTGHSVLIGSTNATGKGVLKVKDVELGDCCAATKDVYVLKLDVEQVPDYLFAGASYHTPVLFRILGLPTGIDASDITNMTFNLVDIHGTELVTSGAVAYWRRLSSNGSSNQFECYIDPDEYATMAPGIYLNGLCQDDGDPNSTPPRPPTPKKKNPITFQLKVEFSYQNTPITLESWKFDPGGRPEVFSTKELKAIDGGSLRTANVEKVSMNVTVNLVGTPKIFQTADCGEKLTSSNTFPPSPPTWQAAPWPPQLEGGSGYRGVDVGKRETNVSALGVYDTSTLRATTNNSGRYLELEAELTDSSADAGTIKGHMVQYTDVRRGTRFFLSYPKRQVSVNNGRVINVMDTSKPSVLLSGYVFSGSTRRFDLDSRNAGGTKVWDGNDVVPAIAALATIAALAAGQPEAAVLIGALNSAYGQVTAIAKGWNSLNDKAAINSQNDGRVDAYCCVKVVYSHWNAPGNAITYKLTEAGIHSSSNNYDNTTGTSWVEDLQQRPYLVGTSITMYVESAVSAQNHQDAGAQVRAYNKFQVPATVTKGSVTYRPWDEVSIKVFPPN